MNLNQVTLPSKDLDKSVKFYKKLGFNLIVDALPNYARFECPDGDSSFSLHKVEELISNSGVSIYFEIQEIDQKVNELVKKGIQFDEAPIDKGWLWRESRLKDPDGNQLILFYGGKNRLNPTWRIN
ncbi:VOC family protein [Fulvivirga lutea]|uniref:VOC family protein n=1 Tax=Fulvivirga lutea TaxID=2810512 RepID=A0A975A1T7_9BACT|nr:VOC family protein [Fulvivirga lutea]QSE98691.1 VOC family protein [Fulvivirga lutea]